MTCDRCGQRGHLRSRRSDLWLCVACDADLLASGLLAGNERPSLTGQDPVRQWLLATPQSEAQAIFQETGLEPQSGCYCNDLPSLKAALNARNAQDGTDWCVVTGGIPAHLQGEDASARRAGAHPIKLDAATREQLLQDLMRPPDAKTLEGLADGVREGMYSGKRVEQIARKGLFTAKDAARLAAEIEKVYG